MEANLLGTISFFSNTPNFEGAYRDMGSSSNWFVFDVDPDNKICSHLMDDPYLSMNVCSLG